MRDKEVSQKDTEEHTRKKRRNLILSILLTAVACIFVFLLLYYLEDQFKQAAPWFEAGKTFAIALLPAVVVALLDHFHTIGEVTDRMAQLVAKEITDRIAAGRERYGLVGFVDSRPYAALFTELQVGDELLWLDTYGPNYRLFVNEIEPALVRGANIRMLVIDPDCANASSRAEEILEFGYDPPRFRRELIEFRDIVVDAAKRASRNPLTTGSCQIVSYSNLPCVPMYIILRNGRPFKGYSSLFLTRATPDFVHFEWTQRTGGLLEEMTNYFEHKWKIQLEGTDLDRRPRGQVLYSSKPPDANILPAAGKGTTDETDSTEGLPHMWSIQSN